MLNSFSSTQIHSSWWLQVVELMAHLLKDYHQHPPAATHTAHFAETPSNCGPPQTGTSPHHSPQNSHTCPVSLLTPGLCVFSFSLLLEQHSQAGETSEQEW